MELVWEYEESIKRMYVVIVVHMANFSQVILLLTDML